MENFRYVITHEHDLLERFAVLAERLFREIDDVPPEGVTQRAAQVGHVFPLLVFDGDELVAGICPTVRDASNQHLLLPEEEGTESRILGSHPLFARRFIWSNHVCVDPRYKGSGIFRELCYHLSALARVFHADSIGLTCRQKTAEMYKVICEKYAGLRGDIIEIDFELPPRHQQTDCVFFVMPAAGSPVPDIPLQRLREHCERHGIQMPA